MESDRNTAMIKTKSRTEVPQDWIDVVESSIQNPSPFKIIDVDQGVIRNWTEFLEDQFVKKCPFQTRPIKEVRVEATSQKKYVTATATMVPACQMKSKWQIGPFGQMCYLKMANSYNHQELIQVR